ncbi:MAG: TonB-dependent receptor [Bacteroidales bacterium]|nr:TonB-dependent receptor [Bacteroidales bacterium]
MKAIRKILLSFAMFGLALGVMGQGTTTAGMNGQILDESSSPLAGATVVAVHEPTGSQFGAITGEKGFFRIPNMNIGGPYKVTISYVGYENYERGNINLNLGQTIQINVKLGMAKVAIAEVEIVGRRVKEYDVFDGNRTGAETVVGAEQIGDLPSVNRNLADFTRMTPQAIVDGNGAISIAGINNRYNAISFDGAVNNDVFGLSPSGTNGGQTYGSPISMDAIEQFQITLAPYDVRQSGFAGASINAVTRSGSNKVTGSAYYFFRNEGLAGKTPTDNEEVERTKLPEFSSNTYGFRVGGPIIKNKLFFFINAEMQREQTPKPFDFADYSGDSDQAAIDAVATKLLNDFGYDAGSYMNKADELNSNKLIARIDWNINRKHKLMFRHGYTSLEAIKTNSSSSRSLNFLNNAQYFPSVTNSTAIELKSNLTSSSNSLMIGFTSVRDDRDPYGDNFPAVRVYDGSGTLYFGSEPYSTANALDQNVLTITDNYSIYKGKHTITVGTNIELSSTYNLFMRKNFGEYRYSTVDDFMTVGTAGEVPAYQYERGYSLVDDITGDGSAAAADFNMLQWGLYVQDEFQASQDLKITFGVRMDMPMFLTDNPVDDHFNNTTIPELEAAGWDMEGAQSGQMPKSALMFSPRVGFNWDLSGDKSTQLRGGVGVFTSRLPLVWPGGSYTNSGVTIGGVYHRSSWGTPITFRPEWDNQYKNPDFGYSEAAYGGQVDLFAQNFKFPQMFRANLAVDQKLPGGIIGTVEVLYTKTLNNVNYFNVNVDPNPANKLDGADNRNYFSDDNITDDYTRVMLGTNTNEGYTYNFTAQLQKPFSNGLTASLAYTYGRAMALNDGTSSQNSSQWRYMENVSGLNYLDLSISDFDLGHRVLGYVNYKVDWIGHMTSSFTLYYNGQSGDVYSYVYNDYGDLNGEGENAGNLIYVPASQSEIVFSDAATSGAQWTALDNFIENDDYLSTRRGKYAERNAARMPFASILDFKFAQDIYVSGGDIKHTLQLTFDLFNLGNLINNKWGRMYYVGNKALRLIDFEGFADDVDGGTPTFSFDAPEGDVWDIDDIGVNSSRWQAQIGIRYIF